MSGTVKGSASRRRINAEQTRRQVIDAALPLFIESGYEATSMRRLAEAGDVSLQTLYNSFTSKFGLFSAVMEVVIAGDHEPVTVAERPAMRTIEELDDPGEVIRAAVEAGIDILGGLSPIYPTLRAAAVTDPEVGVAYQAFVVEARRADHRRVAERLVGVAAVALDVERVTDILWTILGPDTYHALVVQRQWSVDDFATWATETLQSSILEGSFARRKRPRKLRRAPTGRYSGR